MGTPGRASGPEPLPERSNVPAPMQAGDVAETCADVSDLEQAIGFRPTTTIEEGIRRFVAWYRSYHAVPAASDKVHP